MANQIADEDDADISLDIAPSIDFIPSKGVLAIQEGEDWSAPGLSLHFDLKVKSEQTIEAAHDCAVDLGKTAEWGLSLYRGAPESGALPEGAAGRINYYRERDRGEDFAPETSSVWAHLAEERFDLLAELVSKGRLPSTISVAARGLEYGSVPDHRVKRWNVRKRPNLLVKAISFGYATETAGLKEEWIAETAPPTLARAQDIEDARASLAGHLSRIGATLHLLIWLAAAATLILLFK